MGTNSIGTLSLVAAFDRTQGESPYQGVFREFAEELLGQDKDEAKTMTGNVCKSTASALVGGRPFVHKNYVMFVLMIGY